jgi:hypothetical protein
VEIERTDSLSIEESPEIALGMRLVDKTVAYTTGETILHFQIALTR